MLQKARNPSKPTSRPIFRFCTVVSPGARAPQRYLTRVGRGWLKPFRSDQTRTHRVVTSGQNDPELPVRAEAGGLDLLDLT